MQVRKRPVSKKEILKKEKYIKQIQFLFFFCWWLLCSYASFLYRLILIYTSIGEDQNTHYAALCGAIGFSNFTLIVRSVCL